MPSSRKNGCALWRHVVVILGTAAISAAIAAEVSASEFYVDPVLGSPSGDGSAASPWRTLEEVIEGNLIETREWASYPYQAGAALVPVNAGAPVQAGDTIWLRTGFHGEAVIRDAYNVAPITLAAQPGHVPRISRLELRSVQHWVVRGISISPFHSNPPAAGSTIVSIDDHSFSGPTWDVVLEDSDLFTVADASSWSAQDWISTARSGVGVGGERVTVRSNRVRNVRFGISVDGDHALISRNLIDGFSADGLRGLGDDGVYEYNRVQNNLVTESQGDGNHDDGFQSWSVGPGGVGTGEVRNVVLRGNVFVNHVDPSHPLRSSMQAIGCFDGRFVGWVVENNVVVTDHWHGISFYGMDDSRIVNNTVVDLAAGSPGPPWILVTDHKNGTPSSNVVVRNNLVTDLSTEGVGIVVDHNLEVSALASFFVAPPFDLHLLPGTGAVDTGSAVLAPPLDAEGIPRPHGGGVDLGAYELCEGCVFLDGFESGDTSAWRTRTLE